MTITHVLRRLAGLIACSAAVLCTAASAQSPEAAAKDSPAKDSPAQVSPAPVAPAQVAPSQPAPAETAPACPPTARVPTNEQVQAGMRDARDHGFLWRLRRDGRVSFLYGTVHVARAAWMYPGPRTMRALNGSDTVALELDLLDPDIQRRLATAMAATAADGAQPSRVPAPLPAALQQRLQRQFDAECLPTQALAALGPEMQIATLASLAGRRDGLDPSYGIDLFLAGWAHAAKKTVVSLETPEMQIALLRADTDAERNEFVQSALAQIEGGQSRPLLRRLTQAWADGDLGEFVSYGEWCDCMKTEADRAAMVRLLDDRNPALADAVSALHARGSRVFAAVGSLHMAGPAGLPALLAQRGFQVERLP